MAFDALALFLLSLADMRVDRLFFGMVLVNMILAGSELISYLIENSSVSFMRELMYFLNTVFYRQSNY